MGTPSRSADPPVAIVTGASGGIGYACAALLAMRGFRVFGTSRKPAIDAPRRFALLVADVRDDASAAECAARVVAETGRIDVLVNNAGVAVQGAVEETSLEQIKAVFETNFFGAIRMIHAVLPTMRAQHRGRIINIGSVGGFLPMPYQAAYCATKHALRGYSESLDHEVRSFGVRSIIVEPGFVQTDLAINTPPPARPLDEYVTVRADTSRNIAKKVHRGIAPIIIAQDVLEAATSARPKLRYLPGREAKVLALMRRALPARWFDRGLRKALALE